MCKILPAFPAVIGSDCTRECAKTIVLCAKIELDALKCAKQVQSALTIYKFYGIIITIELILTKILTNLLNIIIIKTNRIFQGQVYGLD